MSKLSVLFLLICSINYDDILLFSPKSYIKILVITLLVVCSLLNFGIITILMQIFIQIKSFKKYSYTIKEVEKYIMIFSNIFKNTLITHVVHNTKKKTIDDVYNLLEENKEDDMKFKEDDMKFKEDDMKFKEDILNILNELLKSNEKIKLDNAKLKEKIRNLEKKSKKKIKKIEVFKLTHTNNCLSIILI